MTLVAKPIIDKQFWVLQKNNEKVGNVEACDDGFQVRINNQVVAQYKTIKLVERNVDIHFESAVKTEKKSLFLIFLYISTRLNSVIVIPGINYEYYFCKIKSIL